MGRWIFGLVVALVSVAVAWGASVPWALVAVLAVYALWRVVRWAWWQVFGTDPNWRECPENRNLGPLFGEGRRGC